MVVLSEKVAVANLQRQVRILEQENARLRQLLEVAREHLRRSTSSEAGHVLAKLNGVVSV